MTCSKDRYHLLELCVIGRTGYPAGREIIAFMGAFLNLLLQDITI